MEKGKTHFTSDPHFGHGNIIKYSKRPFAPPELIEQWIAKSEKVPRQYIDAMDHEMIRRWNAKASPEDTVYLLGDVSFHRDERRTNEILYELNGTIHLVPGNHDPVHIQTHPRFTNVSPLMELRIDGCKVTLCHYAMMVWNKSHRDAIQLHGHSHGSMPGNSQRLDVGVDCWDYQPCTFDEIRARLKTLPPYRSVDHHQSRNG